MIEALAAALIVELARMTHTCRARILALIGVR